MENKNIKHVNIEIKGDKWKKAIEESFEKANAKAKIDGFRPGKAPKEVYIKKYGEHSLYIEAAESLLQDAYMQVFQENKDLEIVAQPDVAIGNLDKDGVEYVFTLTLKPEVKLGKYKDLKVAKDKVEVTKEEVDNALEQTLVNFSEERVKADKIVAGDTAIIDFEGFKDEVPFEGGKGENYPLKIGSNTFIPGFEEQLIGMKTGETKDINVTFPEEYHSDELKGAPVVFKVTIKEVKETIVPELNEEFFEDFGMEGITTEESLRKQLEENLVAKKEMEAENKYIDKLLEECAKTVEIDIPEVMIDEETQRMISQFDETLKMQGLNLESYYQLTQLKEENLKEQMKPEATNRVKYRLMLEEIAKVENISITDEKAEEEAIKLAEKYQMEKEEFLKLFGGIEMIKYDLQMRGAIEVLKS